MRIQDITLKENESISITTKDGHNLIIAYSSGEICVFDESNGEAGFVIIYSATDKPIHAKIQPIIRG